METLRAFLLENFKLCVWSHLSFISPKSYYTCVILQVNILVHRALEGADTPDCEWKGLWVPVPAANTRGPKQVCWYGGRPQHRVEALPLLDVSFQYFAAAWEGSSVQPDGKWREESTTLCLCAQGTESRGSTNNVSFIWFTETATKNSICSSEWILIPMFHDFVICLSFLSHLSV